MKYYTGFIAWGHEINFNKKLIGKNFKIKFEIPHKSRDTIKISHSYNTKKRNRRLENNYELVIYTYKEKVAYKVQELLYASLYLANSHIPLSDSPILIVDESKDNVSNFRRNKFESTPDYMICSGIFRCAEIAVKCSFRLNYYYALLKYKLACSLHSNDIMDLDPHFGDYTDLSKYLPGDHIRMGYAIVLFYSVIEQLGLEIKSSSSHPSIIENQWNPIVKEELENRLKRNGIDILEKCIWSRRFTSTKIERKKRPINTDLCSWTKNYQFVRDIEIDLVDAIRIVSWIRSSVVSHKTKNLINSISVYDVANANFLAGRLLLEKIELYKII